MRRGELARDVIRWRRVSTAWWTLGVVALVGLTLAFYPSVKESSALSSYAKDLPKAMRALFAGGETDFASAPGYLNSQIFALMAPVLLIIFAIGFGARVVAGDEEQGTLDLILSHPVSRARLVLERFAAVVALVGLLTVVLFATVALGSPVFDLEISTANVAAASGSVGLLALLYGTLALAVGCLGPGRGRAIGVASGLAVAAWMLDSFGQIVGELEDWRPLSPVYQAVGTNPIRDGVPVEGWLILAGITAALVALAVLALRRRDVLA